MIIPNKLFTYQESILSKLPIALEELEKGPLHVKDLYKKMLPSINGVSEYMDLLDCLYALNKIEFDKERGEIIYVR